MKTTFQGELHTKTLPFNSTVSIHLTIFSLTCSFLLTLLTRFAILAPLEVIREMRCLDHIREVCKRCGATLDESSTEHTLTADAPAGYVWRATGETSLHVAAASHGQSWYASAAKELLAEMSMGLDLVTDETERERIENEIDAPWQATPDAPAFIAVQH